MLLSHNIISSDTLFLSDDSDTVARHIQSRKKNYYEKCRDCKANPISRWAISHKLLFNDTQREKNSKKIESRK